MSGLKNNCPKIVVTGGAGYIGSVLVRQLLSTGYAVSVIDDLCYGGCGLVGVWEHPHFQFHKEDIRNKDELSALLEGSAIVIHLAAIVGKPACFENKYEAWSTNYAGTCYLLRAAEKASVEHFIFASTCSNYGVSDWATEESPLEPLSLYAETKVAAEERVLASNVLLTTVLRFATAYGMSPRMRFDLLVNEFVRDALGRGLEVYGPSHWRPLVHVEDIAGAIKTIIAKQATGIFNIGGHNRRKKGIAGFITRHCPQARVEVREGEEDPRNYRVNFNKISKLGFTPAYTPEYSIANIASAMEVELFGDPYSGKYRNDRPVQTAI